MRDIEAQWLNERLDELPAESVSPILEIGSSSLNFRTIQKPHIEKLVHAPQRKRGVIVVTADIRDEEGVDIVGDVYDPVVQKQLKAVKSRTLLLCNLFEHLTDPGSFARVCKSFVSPGGFIIVTVPYDYPYHLDPIDTMFRPDVAAIHALFPGTDLVTGEILVDGSYWTDLRKQGGSPIRPIATIAIQIAKVIALRGGLGRVRSRISRIRYLFRNYKIAAAILKVPTESTKT